MIRNLRCDAALSSTLWWSVCTLTSVGYGDVIPETPFGKFCGGIIALLGIGIFALPAGILASGFEEEQLRRRTTEYQCPICKEPVVLKNGILTKIDKYQSRDE